MITTIYLKINQYYKNYKKMLFIKNFPVVLNKQLINILKKLKLTVLFELFFVKIITINKNSSV